MVRIALMAIKNLFHVPVWIYRIYRMGRNGDSHTEQERYDYLRKIVQRINTTGRIQVEGFGEENIPLNDGFILFPNHQGLFDMLAIIHTCSHSVSVVIKKEASNIILVKQVIQLLRGISIDRHDIKEAANIIRQMSDEVRTGRNYVIFAEGTRSRNGNEILDFKSGTFKSAVRAGCPIVPVALINSYKPFDQNSIKSEQVQVHYLNPIYPEQYMGLKTKEIADIVHNQIKFAIEKNK